mmetsp:Transcript_17141/g.57912  ORF Transcript_17141/g.57912 Transcript_17141/m.57912 type:complete len:223 (-) Transcript_17141:362-1030(-)
MRSSTSLYQTSSPSSGARLPRRRRRSRAPRTWPGTCSSARRASSNSRTCCPRRSSTPPATTPRQTCGSSSQMWPVSSRRGNDSTSSSRRSPVSRAAPQATRHRPSAAIVVLQRSAPGAFESTRSAACLRTTSRTMESSLFRHTADASRSAPVTVNVMRSEPRRPRVSTYCHRSTVSSSSLETRKRSESASPPPRQRTPSSVVRTTSAQSAGARSRTAPRALA